MWALMQTWPRTRRRRPSPASPVDARHSVSDFENDQRTPSCAGFSYSEWPYRPMVNDHGGLVAGAELK